MSRRHVVQTVVASVASATAASAVTWYLTKKAYEDLFDQRVAEEVKTSVEFLKSKDLDFEKVDVVAGDLPDIPDELEEGFDTPPIEDPEGERIFPGQADKPPLEELVREKVRYDKVLTENDYKEPASETGKVEDPNITVITEDLFNSNVSEYEQSVLVVFSDGGVLDIQGNFVPDASDLIGLPPYPFGEMSSDKDAVYIRNKKLEREFEVVRDPGKAADFLGTDVD